MTFKIIYIISGVYIVLWFPLPPLRGGGQGKWSLLEDFQRFGKKNELEDVRGREKQEYKDKIGKLVEKYYICL